MTGLARLLAFVACAALCSGCPSRASREAIKQCHFTLRTIDVSGYGPLEVELLVTLGVHNPNDIEVVVDQMDYTVYLNGEKLTHGRTSQDITIPVGGNADIPISARLNAIELGRAAFTLLRGDDRVLKVRATYYIELPWGREPFPFEIERRF